MSDVSSGSRPVGLVVHAGRRDAVAAAGRIVRTLAMTGTPVVGVKDEGWTDDGVSWRSPEDFGEGLGIVVALGGDGTLLRAAYLARDRGLPLLGVNLGRLGFLSEIEATQIDEALM